MSVALFLAITAAVVERSSGKVILGAFVFTALFAEAYFFAPYFGDAAKLVGLSGIAWLVRWVALEGWLKERRERKEAVEEE